jgi:5-methylcytosine-specific restriction endonuclease McrA
MPLFQNMKINRNEIWLKYGKKCAYCGVELTLKQMQVDHIEPHWHNLTETEAQRVKLKKGSHDVSNLNPSCSRCNKWKSTYSVEQFRKVIQSSLNRLERDTPNFRLARDYGLLIIQEKPVIFYFEQLMNDHNNGDV